MENKKFTKDDLKVGYVVKFRSRRDRCFLGILGYSDRAFVSRILLY